MLPVIRTRIRLRNIGGSQITQVDPERTTFHERVSEGCVVRAFWQKHERSLLEYCAAAYYLLSEPKSGLGTLVAAGWVAIHTSLRGYRTTHTADAPYKTT